MGNIHGIFLNFSILLDLLVRPPNWCRASQLSFKNNLGKGIENNIKRRQNKTFNISDQ